jgi:hypothetical protein
MLPLKRDVPTPEMGDVWKKPSNAVYWHVPLLLTFVFAFTLSKDLLSNDKASRH